MNYRHYFIVSAFALLSACNQPVTYAPEVTAEELQREEAHQQQLINEAAAKGGRPRAWRNQENMSKMFVNVGSRIEEPGAQICQTLGVPQMGRRCYFYFEISRDRDPGAYADGTTVVVNRGLLRFVASEEELAMVMSHELAHNIMGHPQAGMENAMVGAMIGAVFDGAAASQGVNTRGDFMRSGAEAGALSYSSDFEREADYIGLYIMARAGYNIHRVADFWRRLSVEEPLTAGGGGTHPSNPERFVAINKIVKEIDYKRKHRVPLTPDMKPQ